MPGDEALRGPVAYPNWMWIVGGLLALAAIAWIAFWVVRHVRGVLGPPPELVTLSQAERRRYLGLVEQIERRYRSGDLDLRGVHLALAGLMRALATVRTGRDLEVATVAEIDRLVPSWPQLGRILRECERASFAAAPRAGEADAERAFRLAREAVTA